MLSTYSLTQEEVRKLTLTNNFEDKDFHFILVCGGTYYAQTGRLTSPGMCSSPNTTKSEL